MDICLLKSAITPYQVNLNNFRKIISCNWIENPEKFGISNDIVIKVYNDHNQLQVRNVSQSDGLLKVVYIQEEKSDSELQNLLHVISIFNQLNSVNPYVYCDVSYSHIFQNYSNEHIKFIDNIKNILLEADVIITYGSSVIHFLKQKVPVIIFGPYGLGGWVTTDNFPFLLKNGFVGRAGGSMWEYIPPEILAHELLTIKNCKNLSSIIIANKVLADGLPYKPLSATTEIIEENMFLQKQLTDPQARWQKIPFMASNLLYEYYDGTVAIKRKYINDTLCTVSQEDMPFFKSINGKINCEELYKGSQMDENDFWETIYSLNEKKIIFF